MSSDDTGLIGNIRYCGTMEQKGAATEPFDEELQAKGCDLSFPVR